MAFILNSPYFLTKSIPQIDKNLFELLLKDEDFPKNTEISNIISQILDKITIKPVKISTPILLDLLDFNENIQENNISTDSSCKGEYDIFKDMKIKSNKKEIKNPIFECDSKNNWKLIDTICKGQENIKKLGITYEDEKFDFVNSYMK